MKSKLLKPLSLLSLPLVLVGTFFCLKSLSTLFNTRVLGDSTTINTPQSGGAVLSATSSSDFLFNVNVPANFADTSTFSGPTTFLQGITAPNIIYSLKSGAGISISSSQTPTITNTGVLSLNSSSGDLSITTGDGLSISGLKLTNTGILSLTAGDGITTSGSTITNSDKGSSQSIFKTISVSGQENITANSNTASLTLQGLGGLTITTDPLTNTLSLTSATPDYTLSGWTHNGTTNTIYPSTLTDKVGIGLTNPTNTLQVAGTGYFSDTLTAGGALAVTGDTNINGNITLGNNSADSLTFLGRLTDASGLFPLTDIQASLGDTNLRFKDLWVANINSNSSQSFSGQTTFSYAPLSDLITQATVLVNPATSFASGQLIGFGINGYQRVVFDAEGDLTLGYNNLTSAPATQNPLMLYGHNSTNILSVNTTGDLTSSGNIDINGTTNDIAGTLNLSGNSLTSSGALTITPNSGSNLNINLATTGDFRVNTNQLTVDTSTGFVGIGTTSPTSNLDIAAISGSDAFRLSNAGSKVLGLAYVGNNITLDTVSTDPTNKLTNGTFESDLTSWSTTPSYALNDQFTTSAPTTLVSGGLSAPTPILGSELVIDPGFDNTALWNKGASWTVSGGVATSTGGVASYLDPAAGGGSVIQNYKWYQWSGTVTLSSGSFSLYDYSSGILSLPSTGTYIKTFWRYLASTNRAEYRENPGVGTLDNVSLKELTLSSLFSTTTEATTNKIVSAGVTLTSGTNAGIVLNLDSASNPQNFVIAYHDGTQAHLEKNVGGTYTSLIATNATYVAGATLKVAKNGTSYSLFYNGAQVGTTQTISDAGIVSNTLQGLFSTYASNSFTNFLITTNLDGTSAEPTGGARTVVDTNSKLSITGGNLSMQFSAGTYDPNLYYGSITRGAGKILFAQVTPSALAQSFTFGFGADRTSFTDSNAIYFSSGGLRALYTGNANPTVNGDYIGGVNYSVAIVLKTSGAYYYIKGGTYTNWTLLWIEGTDATNTIYPGIAIGTGMNATADNIRIPTATWLPTPIAYDTFSRSDGSVNTTETLGPDSQTTTPLTWTGGIISSNKLTITPTIGVDMISNGGFDTDTVWTKGTGWAISGGTANATTSTDFLTSGITTAVGTWYQQVYTATAYTAGTFAFYTGLVAGPTRSSTGTFTEVVRAGFTTPTRLRAASSLTASFDNISVKPLTTSSLFSSVSTSDSDVIADANVTLTSGTQAGLVLNLDSTTSPANFILVYHDGTSVKVDEAVAGVYTNKQTTTVTYSAGATLRAIKDGNKLRVYYNNALVGAELTMTANTNTKHGLFSTYASNTFDNFTLWPRGSSTTKFTDAPFEELTATRVTSPTYNTSSGSVQLVTTGTDANYTQSVNVGDTSTYTITAYAYKDGTTVSSSDLSLYYADPASTTSPSLNTLTTSYIPTSQTGWYKLQATVTGVASSRDYGVRVKANKTIYLDNLSITQGTGTANTIFLTNNTTGTTKLNVQDTTTLNAGSLTSQALIVKGFSGQTANLSDWQNSTGTVLGSVSNLGLASFSGLNSNIAANINGLTLASGGLTKLALKYNTDSSVTLDMPTTSTGNLFTNPTLDSNLTSWDYGNTLLDTFSTAYSAGSVNGTAADTGGTRTVVDTNSKLSISSGSLSVATGGVTYGNPGLWYPSQSRNLGTVMYGVINQTTANETMFGFDTNTTVDPRGNAFHFSSSTNLNPYDNGVDGPVLVSRNGIGYYALILRSSGAYYFYKDSTLTNWTFLWSSSTNNTATLYPNIAGYTGTVFTADNIKIPTSNWLPVPLAYSTFTTDSATSTETTGPDGQTTPSLALTGGTVSSGTLSITPTLGSDVVTNGGFDSDTSGWTITDGSGASVAGGQSGNALEITNVSSLRGYAAQTLTTTSGLWYSFDGYHKIGTGSGVGGIRIGTSSQGNQYFAANNGTDNSWTEYPRSFRSTQTNAFLTMYSDDGTTGHTTYFDTVSVKPLTLSSLFGTVSTSDSDVIADANVTLTSGTQAGLVLNLDSTTSPANFILVYHNGTSVIVDEAVAGVYTNKQTTTVTYSAGATLRAIREGTKLRVYYNNALVGSELTMTANTNTKHGLFSTYASNTFDNFTLWARGTGNEYTDLPENNLTVTQETSTTYGGSTGSTKLVSSTSGAAFTQSINVGDTSSYNLSAAVYTNGSAVTSQDVELTAGGILLPTTFTSLGGGWYRANATVTGVASSKPYGVYVHANRTVYVDNLSLIVSTGLTSTFNIANTLTGLGQLAVESTTTLNSGLASLKALIVKGVASQTALLTDWQNSAGTTLASLSANGLFNASTGGLATYTKAGTISDTDFTDTPVNGLMAVDTLNNKLFVRANGAWSWIAFTGGFQIPQDEGVGMVDGDFLMPFVEKHLEDGSLHGLYTKFSDVKDTLLAEEHTKLATLSSELTNLKKQTTDATISASTEFKVTEDLWTNLGNRVTSFKNNLLLAIAQFTNLESNVLSLQNSVYSGTFIIPAGIKSAKVIYPSPFLQVPFIQITPVGELTGTFFLSEILPDYFIVNLTASQSADFTFNWIASSATQSANMEVVSTAN